MNPNMLMFLNMSDILFLFSLLRGLYFTLFLYGVFEVYSTGFRYVDCEGAKQWKIN